MERTFERDERIYSIYALRDPSTNEIRYVGITENNLLLRLAQHISESYKPRHSDRSKYNHLKMEWIRNLGKTNQYPKIETLFYPVYGKIEAEKFEAEIIKSFTNKGYNLFNVLSNPNRKKKYGQGVTRHNRKVTQEALIWIFSQFGKQGHTAIARECGVRFGINITRKAIARYVGREHFYKNDFIPPNKEPRIDYTKRKTLEPPCEWI
ncbi:MAG TPA: GIY-YIG nuclease family protein [Cyclobacteriaceae bacterium]|nr:GIY-YIG nuclease family protein [Cyclobacteriaceae bacterium]